MREAMGNDGENSIKLFRSLLNKFEDEDNVERASTNLYNLYHPDDGYEYMGIEDDNIAVLFRDHTVCHTVLRSSQARNDRFVTATGRDPEEAMAKPNKFESGFRFNCESSDDY